MVRKSPEENLYDFIRQILQLKLVYDFLSDGGGETASTNEDASLAEGH